MAWNGKSSFVQGIWKDGKQYESTSRIGVLLGDGTAPTIAQIAAFAATVADPLRGITHGALNRIDSVKELESDDVGNIASGYNEVEEKARLRFRNTVGKMMTISIPGVNSASYTGDHLNTSNVQIAPIIDAILTGIEVAPGVFVRPIDSNGRQLASLVDARKHHVRSLLR